METKKLVAGIIAAAISIIVLASVLIPVLDDATATNDTFKNEGWVHMKKYDTTAEITAFWDHTKPHQITVGSTDIELPIGAPGAEFVLTACGTATFLLRYSSTSETTGALLYNDVNGNLTASTAAGTDMTISISGGTITATVTGQTARTGTYTDYLFFVSDDTGGYVMKKPTVKAYLNEDSEVVGIGRTALGTNGTFSFVIEGNIEDGWTGSVYQTTGPVLSDITGVYSVVDSHLDLYSFDKITLTATISDTDYPVTYNQVIVPYEVTAEKAQHLTDGMSAILNVIPIMIIIAVLLGVLGLYMIRRE